MSYVAIVLADSPVSYWKLSETTGTAAADSADSNPGVYTGGYTLNQTPGPLTGSGDNSPGVALNGSNADVTVASASNLQLVAPMSLEAWVKPTDRAGFYSVIFKGTTGDFLWYLTSSNGLQVFQVANGTSVTSATAPATGSWSHIVVTYDGAHATFYVNGTPDTPLTLSSSVPQSASALYLGTKAGAASFKGQIAQVAAYGTVLSSARVAAHYNAGISLPPTSGFFDLL